MLRATPGPSRATGILPRDAGVREEVAEPKRILIVRPSALGDVCRTVPVLATLRRAYPAAVIDWVVQDDFVEAIASHPALDEAIVFPRNTFARRWWNPAVLVRIPKWIADLHGRRYDVAYDFQGLWRSGMIMLATGAARRVGRRSARELAWVGYNVKHPDGPGRHSVEKMMAILAAEGLSPVYDMRLYVAEEDRAWWRRCRPGLGAAGRYAVLAATSRWPSKRWPAASWSALVEPLRGRGYGRIVLVGAPGEEDQVADVTSGPAAAAIVDLVGRTSVGQTMAVVEDAELVIANDSAPLHFAVGLGRPCIGLYGPTDPATEGPFCPDGAPVRVLRSAPTDPVRFRDRRVGDALMRSISPAEVLDALDDLVAQAPAVQDGGAITATRPAARAPRAAAPEARP